MFLTMRIQKEASPKDITEEVIKFCVNFVDSIEVLVSRHEGRLLGKGTIGRKASLTNDTSSFHKAHLAVSTTIILGDFVYRGTQVGYFFSKSIQN
jgi:hypothetical protein